MRSSGSRQGLPGGLHEWGDKISRSKKCEKLDKLFNYQLVGKDYCSLDLGMSRILLNPYIVISPIPFDVIEESSLGA